MQQEAKRIRHCALSLVGEPIIYPAINEFLARLHDNKISSFLVTNAQVGVVLGVLGALDQTSPSFFTHGQFLAACLQDKIANHPRYQ